MERAPSLRAGAVSGTETHRRMRHMVEDYRDVTEPEIVSIHYNCSQPPHPLSEQLFEQFQEACMIIENDVPAIAFIPTDSTTQDGHEVTSLLMVQAKKDGRCYVRGVGRQVPYSRMNLAPDFGRSGPSVGNIIHELCHVLGMKHEHQRDDRDGFVNLPKELEKSHNHKKVADVHFGRYDTASIMHYPTCRGTDCAERMTAGPRAWSTPGQRVQLSNQDKLFLNRLYPPVPSNMYNPERSRHTGRWYCGRRVMEENNYPFGCIGCDGRCGPNNGPNCPACIMYGVSQGDEFPLVLGDDGYGSHSTQGETGLMYCGQRMKKKSSIHNGVCGPNNGPNCRECRQLLG